MDRERFQDTSACPDHGQGPMAKAVHGLLAAMGGQRFQPTLATVYNTLADPPGPPGYSLFPVAPALWDVAGQEPQRYFTLLSRGVRAMPLPDIKDLTPLEDVEAPATRLDGMTLVFQGVAVQTATSPAGLALAANVREGYYRRGDVAMSVARERSTMAIAVDRDGHSLVLSAVRGVIVPPVPAALGEYRVGGTIVSGLSDVLDAFWSLLQRVEALDGRRTG
ncbi:hypothetical protein AB0K60_00185 [Thermopolyspora sp. NPDC052614]|uniref:hypothetical protein n=1 Tax=Thermopolyspora sp. NPDC052614 TaxID=3155682 RepID=UPI0034161798